MEPLTKEEQVVQGTQSSDSTTSSLLLLATGIEEAKGTWPHFFSSRDQIVQILEQRKQEFPEEMVKKALRHIIHTLLFWRFHKPYMRILPLLPIEKWKQNTSDGYFFELEETTEKDLEYFEYRDFSISQLQEEHERVFQGRVHELLQMKQAGVPAHELWKGERYLQGVLRSNIFEIGNHFRIVAGNTGEFTKREELVRNINYALRGAEGDYKAYVLNTLRDLLERTFLTITKEAIHYFIDRCKIKAEDNRAATPQDLDDFRKEIKIFIEQGLDWTHIKEEMEEGLGKLGTVYSLRFQQAAEIAPFTQAFDVIKKLHRKLFKRIDSNVHFDEEQFQTLLDSGDLVFSELKKKDPPGRPIASQAKTKFHAEISETRWEDACVFTSEFNMLIDNLISEYHETINVINKFFGFKASTKINPVSNRKDRVPTQKEEHISSSSFSTDTTREVPKDWNTLKATMAVMASRLGLLERTKREHADKIKSLNQELSEMQAHRLEFIKQETEGYRTPLKALFEILTNKFGENCLEGIILNSDTHIAQNALIQLHEKLDAFLIPPAIPNPYQLEPLYFGLRFEEQNRFLFAQVGVIPEHIEQARIKRIREIIDNIKKSTQVERQAREESDKRTAIAKQETEEARKAQEEADQKAEKAESQIEILKQQIALLQRQAQEDFSQKNTAVLLSGGPSGGISTANSVNTNNGATTSGIKEVRSPTVKAY